MYIKPKYKYVHIKIKSLKNVVYHTVSVNLKKIMCLSFHVEIHNYLFKIQYTRTYSNSDHWNLP